MMSEFVFFEYFMDEIVILKNLWIGLNSKSDTKIDVYFDFCYTGELVFLRNYFLIFPDKGFRCFRCWLYMG